jgi:exopolysaccharide biosynthesis polyprenyl glycosylphosphotransferase
MSGVVAVPQMAVPAPAFVPVHAGEKGHRTLLVGTGQRAAALARQLVDAHQHQIIGAVDAERLPHLSDAMPLVPWLGSISDIGPIALAHHADEICVALPLRSCFDQWVKAQAVGQELGIPVSFHFDLMGDGSRVQVAALGEAPLLRCNLHPASLGMAPTLKRLFDIVVASAALVALSPVLLVAALLVKLTSPGPVFFTQPRVGRGRRVFGMIKFRTMVADAEQRRREVESMNDASGIMFKIVRDPRLTIVGPLLRRTSVDELPQLFNVLKGDMSLIGPRPIPTWVYEQIDEPSFHRRFSVLPGMTGLWQVHGRPQEYRLMARYDLQYVEDWSFLLDLRILIRTIPAVLKRQGAQ